LGVWAQLWAPDPGDPQPYSLNFSKEVMFLKS